MLQYAFDAWHAAVQEMQRLENVNWATTLQPLICAHSQKAQESGGNVLGLEGAPPLILMNITATWDSAKDDHIEHKAQAVMDEIAAVAKSRGLFHRFVHMNYAGVGQDPISGYGLENKRFLQEVSKRYDPEGLWQTVLAGDFRLFDERE